MCPFRILVIFFSLLVALLAMFAALAKDPTEEQTEAEKRRNPSKSTWAMVADVYTGRWAYRELKRLMPFFFSADDEEETPCENECDAKCDGAECDANPAVTDATDESNLEPSASATLQHADDEPASKATALHPTRPNCVAEVSA